MESALERLFIHEFTRTSPLYFPNAMSNFEVILTYVGSGVLRYPAVA